MKHAPIDTNVLMAELQARVRREFQARLMERGGAAAFADREVFDQVELIFRRAFETRDRGALLPSAILSEEEDWRIDAPLSVTSHRPVVGRVIVYFKRRVLLPMTRWLYEYSSDNFRRQQRLNETVLACLQTLAIEHARVRQELRSATSEWRSARSAADGGPGNS
jgi:hypothetical protein